MLDSFITVLFWFQRRPNTPEFSHKDLTARIWLKTAWKETVIHWYAHKKMNRWQRSEAFKYNLMHYMSWESECLTKMMHDKRWKWFSQHWEYESECNFVCCVRYSWMLDTTMSLHFLNEVLINLATSNHWVAKCNMYAGNVCTCICTHAYRNNLTSSGGFSHIDAFCY